MKKLKTYGKKNIVSKILNLFKSKSGYILITEKINLKNFDKSDEEQ